MEFIEVEYNRELHELEAVLSDVNRPGDFFAAGTIEIPMPRVEVQGAGELSFPIPRPQIAALIQQSTQAPYGRGAETIVDTSVRNVWQIAPAAVKISGKSWAASFESVLSKVTAGLGCGRAAVSAELYKLLVYDRGGFFLAHRDTEKTAGMFGTLVLTLPSVYRGGALRIRHADREVTIKPDAAGPSEVSFAAFYADCEHEVLPVQAGSRVCLVYNLIQDPAKGKRRPLEAPNHTIQVSKAAAILREYWSSSRTPKIAWLLEHQYSPAGLSFSALKGADAAKAQVMVKAAAQAECAAHLAVVHIEESGAAEEHYFDFSRSRGRRWEYEPEDDEDDEFEDAGGRDSDVEFTAVTVDDSWKYLDEWRDTGDFAADFGRIPLAKGELLPEGALDREPPDEKRLTEASGNEGATFERSYRRAVLVLWPEKRTIDVLLGAGVVATLPYLQRLVRIGASGRPTAIAAAKRIVAAWPSGAGPHRYVFDQRAPQSSDSIAMITALVELNSPALLEKFILQAVLPAYDGPENGALLRAAVALGNSRAAGVLAGLMTARMSRRPNECAELLLALGRTDPSPSFRHVAAAAVEALDGIGRPDPKTEEPEGGYAWWNKPEAGKKPKLPPEFITNLFSALSLFPGRTLHDAAVGKISSRLEVFDPVTVVVPALERMSTQAPPAIDRVIQHLWIRGAEFLLLRSEVPPQPPPDWSLPANLSCTCADCRDLQAFARNPIEQVHHFRIKMERRRHLHQVIERHGLEMTHVTHRVGSPQTLVCTKDRRSFQARMREYLNEIAAMRKLLHLADQSAAAPGITQRLVAAAEASDSR